MEKTLNRSALRNGLYNIVGQVARGAVVVLAIPFLIRFLGIAEYGVWSFAYAFLALLTMCEGGFSVAAVVFLSKDLANNNRRGAGHTLAFVIISAALLSAALASLLWFAGPLLARPLSTFGNAERATAGRALQIAGFGAAILIFQRTLVGIEQAFNRYALINGLDLLQALLTNLGFLLVVSCGGKSVALMKWQILASVFLLAAHACFVTRLCRQHQLHLAWNERKGRQIFRYTVTTWIATLGTAAFGQCDRLVVGWTLGPSSLGIYSAITNITSKINTLSATAVQPVIPSLSRDVELGIPSEGRIRQIMYLNALIAIGGGIFLYVLADWIVRTLGLSGTAQQYIHGFRIATIIYALYSLNAPGFYILFSLGGVRTNAVITLASGLLSLLLIIAGARYFGVIGALAGNAGYLASLLLVVRSLGKTGIALGQYLKWMLLPAICLATALIAGPIMQGHLLWQTGFVMVEIILFTVWFFHHPGTVKPINLALGRTSEG